MAVSQFSAAISTGRSEALLTRSGLLVGGLGSRGSKSKVLLMRTWISRPVTVRRSFSVNSVSSDSDKTLKDPITQEGLFSLIFSFHLLKLLCFSVSDPFLFGCVSVFSIIFKLERERECVCVCVRERRKGIKVAYTHFNHTTMLVKTVNFTTC